MRLFLYYLMLLICGITYSQETVIQLDKSYGTPGVYDGAYNVVEGPEGNFYIYGMTAAFSGNNTNQTYLIKTDPAGNELWSKVFDSNDNSLIEFYEQSSVTISPTDRTTELSAFAYGEQMLLTSDNHLLIIATSTYAQSSASERRGYTYTVKLDLDGNIIWEKILVGSAIMKTQESVIELSNGNFLLTGHSTDGGNGARWLVIDPDGNFVWRRAVVAFNTGGGLAFGQTSVQLGSGNILGTAYSFGGAFGFESHLIEFDLNTGAELGRRVMREEGFNMWVIDMQEVSDGVVLVGSDFSTFDKTVVTKLDTQGQLLWTKTYTNPEMLDTRSYDLAENGNGSYFISGFKVAADGQAKFAIFNVDGENGDFISIETFNDGYNGIGYCIQNTSDGGLLMTHTVDGLLPTGDMAFLKTFGVEAPSYIEGFAFVDNDANCLFNQGDIDVANKLIQVNGENGIYQTLTDNDGKFRFTVEPGDYTVSLAEVLRDNEADKIDPNCDITIFDVNVNKGETVAAGAFAVQKRPGDCILDVQEFPGGGCEFVDINGDTQFGPYRGACPGEAYTYCISYTNDTNGILLPGDMEIRVSLPDFVYNVPTDVTVISENTNGQILDPASPINYTVDPTSNSTAQGNVVIFPSVDLGPGELFTYCITFTIPLNPSNNSFQMDVFGFSDGTGQDCNYSIPNSPYDCSCDPNDLSVSPAGCGPFGNIAKEEQLTYTVRFENIGPGPARDVVVTSMLDDDLDITSLKMGRSSHTITGFQVNPNNEMVVSFEGINLNPLQDAPLNQGYFTYTAYAKPDLADGTIITNRASIVFDSNEPVVTNEVMNTLYDDPSVSAAFTFVKACDSYGQIFEFSYTGGTTDAGFLWDFGPDATPQFSNEEHPANVQFSEGTHDVSLTVTKNGCEETTVQVLTSSDVGSGGRNKMIVCHNGNDITINKNALQAHLDHGDCIGSCGNKATAQTRQLDYFPNPVKDRISVVYPEGISATVYVKDINGRILKKENAEGKTNVTIALSDLVSGLYFVSLVQENGAIISSNKFVKI